MQGNLADIGLEHFADDGAIPNNVLPVVIYRQAIAGEAVSAEALEALFDANGWPSAWRWGVYDFHHYHSNTHECLGVAQGHARLQLGGAQGRVFDVSAGDVIVLPAGVGHKKLTSSVDFLVVGAYPPGFSSDLLRGEANERPAADQRIAKVPLPQTDPVGGQGGPVLEKWG
ncbi:cupin domain-containing protein [Devosia sp. CAU 1758]